MDLEPTLFKPHFSSHGTPKSKWLQGPFQHDLHSLLHLIVSLPPTHRVVHSLHPALAWPVMASLPWLLHEVFSYDSSISPFWAFLLYFEPTAHSLHRLRFCFIHVCWLCLFNCDSVKLLLDPLWDLPQCEVHGKFSIPLGYWLIEGLFSPWKEDTGGKPGVISCKQWHEFLPSGYGVHFHSPWI